MQINRKKSTSLSIHGYFISGAINFPMLWLFYVRKMQTWTFNGIHSRILNQFHCWMLICRLREKNAMMETVIKLYPSAFYITIKRRWSRQIQSSWNFIKEEDYLLYKDIPHGFFKKSYIVTTVGLILFMHFTYGSLKFIYFQQQFQILPINVHRLQWKKACPV